MHKKLHKILVTGGAGFIGSELVRQIIQSGYRPVVIDKLTYAGDLTRLKAVRGMYRFFKVDICDKDKVELVFKKEKPQIVIHFAAESHVDRSIVDASNFIETNVKGTQVLLDLSRKFNVKRFIHMSTDEVYGDIKKGMFFESSPIKASSPYAASKAAADLLVSAYIRTYNFPAIIVRSCNNYGPWQYPEKLIPLSLLRIIKNDKIPIYGKGINVREWLYVSDCAKAIFLILQKGKVGETYNLGSGQEKKNIDVVRHILKILGKSEELIVFVKDRLGHDIRYRLNSQKISKTLGWKPRVSFKEGLDRTVNWYIANKQWV